MSDYNYPFIDEKSKAQTNWSKGVHTYNLSIQEAELEAEFQLGQ